MASVRKSVHPEPCYTNYGVCEAGNELTDVHSDSDETFFVPRSSRRYSSQAGSCVHSAERPVASATQPVSMVLISTTSRYRGDEFCDINLDNGNDIKLADNEVSECSNVKDKSRVRENLKDFAKKIRTNKNYHGKYGKVSLHETRMNSLYSETKEQNALPPFEIRGDQDMTKGQHVYNILSRDKKNQKRKECLPFDNVLHEVRLETTISPNKNDKEAQDKDTANLGSSPSTSHVPPFPSGNGHENTDSNGNIENFCTATCRRSSMVDDLLLSIYRHNRRSDSIEESDTLTEHSTTSDTPHVAFHTRTVRRCPSGGVVHRRFRLINKDVAELQLLVASLQASLSSQCAMLIRELKRRDRLHYRRDQQNDVITAILHALSQKRSQDTRMRFSVAPLPGDSGFMQWHDAMMMCARLPGGIPQEFRRRLWLTLSEKHLQARGVDWSHAERFCFNEWSNPDDDELGDQIVKDLHRTGCSLFCGEEAEDNQAMLKRVLLAYARWNKAVGYCQGFNMLAAIILEVMERQESDALKVMIYLIEGVLPESYFANNLRGLSVDMAVFRDLLRLRLPHLSRHLEHLQHDAADLATGTSYEPPLTNVFTMQWFLTLFSNCLPRETVMRVWDLTFLQGDEVLLRTALAIWDGLAARILEVHSADEFYTVMGVLTQEMLAYGLMDANKLVHTVVGMAPFPFPGLAELRDKYTYNITPWTQSVSSVAKRGLRLFYSDDDDDDNDEDDQKIAVATAFGLSGIFRKGVESRGPSPVGGGSSASPGPFVPFPSARHAHEISRPNLDISALKKQYARLRERQKQAHIILTASQLRVGSSLSGTSGGTQRSTPLAMNHLLRGKKALTSKTKRGVPQGVIPVMEPKKKAERKFSDSTGSRPPPQAQRVPVKSSTSPLRSHYQTLKRPPSSCSQSPPKVETLHWKDTPRRDRRASLPSGVKLLEAPVPTQSALEVQDEADDAEGGSSTSTELCDDEDEDKLSDLEADSTAETRPATTSPRLETVTEHHVTSPAKQPRKKQEAKSTSLRREKPVSDKKVESKPKTKQLIKETQERKSEKLSVSVLEVASLIPSALPPDSEPRDESENKSALKLEEAKSKIDDDGNRDTKAALGLKEKTKSSIAVEKMKVEANLVEEDEEKVKQTKLETRIKKIIPGKKLLEIESVKEPEPLKPIEIKQDLKVMEKEQEIKAVEIKLVVGTVEIKPGIKTMEMKPEIKPEVRIDGIKPEAPTKEIKPEVITEEIKPGVRTEEMEHVVKMEQIQPEVRPEETKPEIRTEKIQPDVRTEEIKPEIRTEKIQPDVRTEEIKPEIRTEKIQPDVRTEEIKPEIRTEKIQPEFRTEEIQLEIRTDEIKPEVRTGEKQPEVRMEDIKPEVRIEEIKPEVGMEDIKPEAITGQKKPEVRREEPKPEVRTKEIHPEVGMEKTKPEVRTGQKTPVRTEQIKPEVKMEETKAANVIMDLRLENKEDDKPEGIKPKDLQPNDEPGEIKQENNQVFKKLREIKQEEIEDKQDDVKYEKNRDKIDEIKLEDMKSENGVDYKEVKMLGERKPEVRSIDIKLGRTELKIEGQPHTTAADIEKERQYETVEVHQEVKESVEISNAQEGVIQSDVKNKLESIPKDERTEKTLTDRQNDAPAELKLEEFEMPRADFSRGEIKPGEIVEQATSPTLSPRLPNDEVAEGCIPAQPEVPPTSSLYSPNYALSYGIPLEVLLAGKNLTAAEIIARIPFPSDVSFMKGPEEIDKFSAQHNVTPQRSPIETTFPDFPSLVPVSETSLTVKMSPDSSPSLSPSPSPRTSPISASPHKSLSNTPSISPSIMQENKAGINWSLTELPSTPPESGMSSPLIPPKSPKITVEDEKKNVFEIHSGVPGLSTFVFHPLEELGKSISNSCPEAETDTENLEIRVAEKEILLEETVQKSKDPSMTSEVKSESLILNVTSFEDFTKFDQEGCENNAGRDMEKPTYQAKKHFNINIDVQEVTETERIFSDENMKLHYTGSEDDYDVSEGNDTDVQSKVFTFRENISKSRLSTLLTDNTSEDPPSNTEFKVSETVALGLESYKADTSHDVGFVHFSSGIETGSHYPSISDQMTSANSDSPNAQQEGVKTFLENEQPDQSKSTGTDMLKTTSQACSSEKLISAIPLVSKSDIGVSETHTKVSSTATHGDNDESLLLHSEIKSPSPLSLGTTKDVSATADSQELDQKSSFSSLLTSSGETEVVSMNDSVPSAIKPFKSNILSEVTSEEMEPVFAQTQVQENISTLGMGTLITDDTTRLSAAESVAPPKISLEERISALLPPETLATWTAKYESDKVIAPNEEPSTASEQEDLSHLDKYFKTKLPLTDESQDKESILTTGMQGEGPHSKIYEKELEPIPAENIKAVKHTSVEKIEEEMQRSPTESISKEGKLPLSTEYQKGSDMLPGKKCEESALLLMNNEKESGNIQCSKPETYSSSVKRSNDLEEFMIKGISQETELLTTKKSPNTTLPFSETPSDEMPHPSAIRELRKSTDELTSSTLMAADESIFCLGDVQEEPPFRRQRGESSLTASLEGRISAFPCSVDSAENVISFDETGEDDAVFESSGPEMETDFFSERDLSSEAIRQRLWRGVKSLSLDADIALDPDIFCFLIQQSSKSSRSKEGKKKGLQQRRNSEVELQELVKENTEIIERIMKQKSVEDAGALIYSIKETDTPANTPIEEHEPAMLSTRSNSNRELESNTKFCSSNVDSGSSLPHKLRMSHSSNSNLSEALSLAKEIRSPSPKDLSEALSQAKEIRSTSPKEMSSPRVTSLDQVSCQGSETEQAGKSVKSSCKTSKISRSSSVSLEGPMRPITFNPFPTRNLPRQPKEVAVKLGLYSPTKTSNGSPTEGPT